MIDRISLATAITHIALAARIHNDSREVLRTARLCFKRLPRASRLPVVFIIGSHRPVEVELKAYEDLVEQGYFDEN